MTTTDQELRINCLRLAAPLPGDVVATAKAMYAFITGESEGLVPQSEAPPTQRKARATKPQDVPAEAAEPAAEPIVVNPEPEPKDDVPEATRAVAQALSVDLNKAHGRDALVGILADFGVARCGELAEDQLADYCANARGRIAAK